MYFKHISFLLLLIALFQGLTETAALQANTNGNVNMALVLQGGPDGTKEGTENALALQGAKDACVWNLPSKQGFQYKTCTLRVLTPASETLGAYSGLIPAKANENDFMMALGYFPSKAIQTASNANGNKLFAIADFEFTPPVGNIVSVMYSEDQIGYLAGLLAGEVAKSRGGKVAGKSFCFFISCFILMCAKFTNTRSNSPFDFSSLSLSLSLPDAR